MLADWVETLHGVQPLPGPAVVDEVGQQSAHPHGLRAAAVQDGQLRGVDQGLAQHHVERASSLYPAPSSAEPEPGVMLWVKQNS